LLAAYSNPRSGARKGQPLRFIAGHHNRGAHNPRYKGRTVSTYGYIYRFVPDHPHANKDGCVMEHRLVMEAMLGRYLAPEEVVHHLSGDRAANDPSNLRLYANNAEHIRAAHGPGARWSSFADACTVCGSATIPHAARGVCRNCYVRLRRHDPASTWGHGYPCCVNCGTTASYHASRGLCHNCDEQRRRGRLANASSN
jgi:hypothetical protein